MLVLAACASPRAEPKVSPQPGFTKTGSAAAGAAEDAVASNTPFRNGPALRVPTGEPPSVQQAPLSLGGARLVATDTTGHFYFTPNGEYLVYLSRRDGLVRVDPDGSNPLVLHPPGPGYFVFTPDSRYVLFPAGSHIMRVPISGGQATTLVGGVSAHVSINVSPDGSLVMYNDTGGPATLISINGGPGRVAAYSMPQYGTHAHFTPDSAGVVHWSKDKTYYHPVQGEGFRPLAPNLETAGLLSAWPKGAVVLGPGNGLWFAPYDGSAAIAFPAGLNVSGMQANARLRAVPTVGDSAGNIYYVDIDSRELRQINRPLEPGETMAWGDNTVPGWYVYTTYRGQGREGRVWKVFSVSTANGTSRALARSENTYTLVAMPTADGARVIMHMDFDDGRMAFFQVDLRTGRLARISEYYPGWNNFYVSPDSRHIVFAVTTSGTGSSRMQDLYTLRLPD
jgi:hypothetical protein